MLLVAALAISGVTQWRSWRRLRGALAACELRPFGATWRYLLLAVTPAVSWGALVLLAVATEELVHRPLIPEPMGRVALPLAVLLLALAGAGSMMFAVYAVFHVRRPP